MADDRKLNIAILGTRGIPNRYGGFEQCAQELARRMVANGHHVTVYSPAENPYREDYWNGVRIRRVFCREARIGIFGTFLFDYLCLRDACKQDFDIILELGYVPAAFFLRMKRKTGTKLVTNMDGMEWQRAKWNRFIKPFVRKCERNGVKYSDGMVADNPGIRDYLHSYYGKAAALIPYGAEVTSDVSDSVLSEYRLKPQAYHMLIARLEPENNIQMILDGASQSPLQIPFLVIGCHTTKYGEYLKKRYKNASFIRFVGGVYDCEKLTALRRYCRLYFHGHSVGGTNPSLLDAMASGARICAHDNSFNREVLMGGGLYFSSVEDVSRLISGGNPEDESWPDRISENRMKVATVYDWDRVTERYLALFLSLLNGKG